jgi:hypothetical protein
MVLGLGLRHEKHLDTRVLDNAHARAQPLYGRLGVQLLTTSGTRLIDMRSVGTKAV